MRRLAVAIVVLLVACTSEPSPQTPSETPSGDPVEVTTGPTSAAEAMRRLCVAPDVEVDPVTEVPTPPAIAEVADQVQSVRGLEFDRPVNVEPITEAEMDRRLADYLGTYYPERFYARRSEAWQTIGALPRDVGYLEAIAAYQQGQVLGFYNSQNEELVYTGDAELNRIEQFVLAHELTHAIDDQHFDLDRLDGLVARCQEERFQAALGIVEGSANHFATQVLINFPIQEIGSIPGDDAGNVPPFIVDLQAYPYTTGQRFADTLSDANGPSAIDDALETFPTTTEQVMHPTKFPHEVGESLDVPDFAPTFGEGWRDLDVMVVGELWLKALLNLRLEDEVAAQAAAGWNGGIYRAWTDGVETAVVLTTAWDSPKDASEFAEALAQSDSQGSGPQPGVIQSNGTRVHAAFASSEELLPMVSSTLGSI